MPHQQQIPQLHTVPCNPFGLGPFVLCTGGAPSLFTSICGAVMAEFRALALRAWQPRGASHGGS